MKILVVEYGDDRSDHPIHTHPLEAEGHDLRVSRRSEEALSLAAADWPDLILMNLPMDNRAAHELARNMKMLCDKRLVPVVFLSSIMDDTSLAWFIESYADDFIDQPHNSHALKAKITVIERSLQTHDSLQRFKHRAEAEIGLARQVFDALMNRRPTGVPNVRHWTWAAGHFSGDVVLYERTPQGRLHILLGDFTGHGLAAALGALPTADAFFAMTRKGMAIGRIADEINQKLHDSMPTGHFCAACIACVDPVEDWIDVWNGGLPPVLVIDGEYRVAVSIPSSKPPLGVLSPENFDVRTERLALPPSARLVIYSDGLTEATNPQGEMFGDDGLEKAIRDAHAHPHLSDSIKSCLISFMDGLEPADDVSLVTMAAA